MVSEVGSRGEIGIYILYIYIGTYASRSITAPERLGVHIFHPTSYSPIFVYLLYIDLSPCLEGHLDPELIQVTSYESPS